jgi:hypothetical protein
MFDTLRSSTPGWPTTSEVGFADELRVNAVDGLGEGGMKLAVTVLLVALVV